MTGLIALFVDQLLRVFKNVVVQEGAWKASAYSRYREKLRENPLRVFISYDWDDEAKVYELYEKLKAQGGIKPWLDKECLKGIDLKDSEAWELKLWEALREAECVIICLSRESIRNRGYFKTKEVPFILEKAEGETELSTYVLLVKLDECKTPRKYGKRDVAELYTESGYENLLDVMVKNAYEELKHKRGVKYAPRSYFK